MMQGYCIVLLCVGTAAFGIVRSGLRFVANRDGRAPVGTETLGNVFAWQDRARLSSGVEMLR